MNKYDRVCLAFEDVKRLIKAEKRYLEIMYAMERCCDELTPNDAENWEFYDYFRDLKSEIHEEAELMDENDIVSCEDTIMNCLEEMYALCYNARVWIG